MIRTFELILHFNAGRPISMSSLAQTCPNLPCVLSWEFYAAREGPCSQHDYEHPLKGFENDPGWVQGILQTKKPMSSIVELDEILVYVQASLDKGKMPIGRIDYKKVTASSDSTNS